MAEREGFEPSVAFLLRSLSKGVLSTTQPPFLVRVESFETQGRDFVNLAGREWRN